MPIQVQGPDGQLLEFPDGTDRETMRAAMAKRYGGPSQPRADFSGVTGGVNSTEKSADDPTVGMSGMELFAAGVGRNITETGRSIRQTIPAAAMGIGRLMAGGPAERALFDKRTEGFRQREQARVDEARRIDAPLLATKAGAAGNIAGTLGQIVGPGLFLRGTTAGAALLPSTVGGNALQGAALGALQSTATGESRLQNTLIGGALGGAGAAAFGLLGRGVSALRGGRPSPVSADDAAAGRIILQEADNPVMASASAPSQVPGVQRTLAEETLDPGIARLERNLRSTDRGFDAIDRSNNAARVAAIERFAGDDAALSAARSERTAQTEALRQQAMQDRGVDLAPITSALEAQLKRTATRPSVQSALLDVQRSLQEAGDDVFSLYGTRKYIDDLLSGKAGADKSYAKAATAELMELKGRLDQQLAKASPSFEQYLQRYREMSVPINRMQVGQALISRKSGSAILDPVTGAQVLTPAQFSKASRSLDDIAAKATGFKKAKATDILQPGDIGVIKAIQDDLERQSFRASAGSGGNSHTFERGMMESRIGQRATNAAAGFVPFGKYAQDFLAMLDKSRNDRVKERLAYLVANPEEARRVLAAIHPKARPIVEKALTQIGGALSRAGVVGGVGSEEPSNPGP